MKSNVVSTWLQAFYIGIAILVLLVSGTVLVGAAPNTASLTLGDSRPSQTTSYTFQVSGLAGTSLRCIEIDLGTGTDGTGAIAGLNTASSTLSSSTLISTAAWTVSNGASADHKLRITNATGAAPNASGDVAWGAVVNGSTANTSYYGVFRTFSDATCATQVETVTIQFIYTNGQLVSLTVDASFTFTVAGVASGGTVNGSTTNVATTSTTVPFGSTTPATNGVAAQDLSITTNASNGYNVYARFTGDLQNSNADNINNHTGTYASPSLFSAAGVEAFGYTAEDVAAFAGGLWAGMETTNRVVASSTTPATTTETNRVGYQAGVATNTPAGNYTTTVIYTAVPTY